MSWCYLNRYNRGKNHVSLVYLSMQWIYQGWQVLYRNSHRSTLLQLSVWYLGVTMVILCLFKEYFKKNCFTLSAT